MTVQALSRLPGAVGLTRANTETSPSTLAAREVESTTSTTNLMARISTAYTSPASANGIRALEAMRVWAGRGEASSMKETMPSLLKLPTASRDTSSAAVLNTAEQDAASQASRNARDTPEAPPSTAAFLKKDTRSLAVPGMDNADGVRDAVPNADEVTEAIMAGKPPVRNEPPIIEPPSMLIEGGAPSLQRTTDEITVIALRGSTDIGVRTLAQQIKDREDTSMLEASSNQVEQDAADRAQKREADMTAAREMNRQGVERALAYYDAGARAYEVARGMINDISHAIGVTNARLRGEDPPAPPGPDLQVNGVVFNMKVHTVKPLDIFA